MLSAFSHMRNSKEGPVVTSVEIPTRNQRVISTLKGILGTILRLGGHVENVEVGVLHHIASSSSIKWGNFY
jgi:hypothetical protein